MLNLNWLHTFKTLIEVGHFTHTAEKLYMTQPGVSQHIKKLEQACGHSLIKREKKSFEITEQGQRVYDYAVQVALTQTKLLDSLNFDDPYAGICKLSCSGALALQLYPALLTLQINYSELVTHLEAAPNDKILNDIQNGKVDIGLVTQAPSANGFHVEKIGTEPLCLILPLRYKDKVLTAATLQECGLVKHPDAEHYLSLYFDLCGSSELSKLSIDEIKTVSYVNQLNQILLPVSLGIGFTVLPQSVLTSSSYRDKLYIHTPRHAVNESLFFVHKRNRQLAGRYQTIKNKILEQLKVND
ncbi:LysR family transcriptional regulator [Shewanella woodyi]|uniref:LysR family transcriptional regulator n=1 Tax=Shewanella woodyi TaxID=60961 RepID=UPI00374A0672